MTQRRKFLLGLGFVACLAMVTVSGAWHSLAQDKDAELQRTQALLEVMGGGATVEQLVNYVYQQTVSTLLAANPNEGPAVQRFVDDHALPQIRARVPAMMAAAAENFSQVFTQEELDEIVAFYQSPVGQKLRRARSGILRETAQLGQFWAAQTFRDTLVQLKPQLEEQGLKAPDV